MLRALVNVKSGYMVFNVCIIKDVKNKVVSSTSIGSSWG